MSADTLFLALAILGSSFWGSWHCAAMCGPIASMAARNGSLALYHLGRGFSYTLIGALGGYLGSYFLSNEFQTVRLVSGFSFAVILVVMGFQTFRGVRTWRSLQINGIHSYFAKKTSGGALGLMSVFLPCGWLYSYVLAAVATRSPWGGFFLMGLFWLGGLPALSALSLFMKKSINLAPRKKQQVAGVILVFAGLYSLMSFYFMR